MGFSAQFPAKKGPGNLTPKTCSKMSVNVQKSSKALAKTNFDMFGILPTWSMLLPGNLVQSMPVTTQKVPKLWDVGSKIMGS